MSRILIPIGGNEEKSLHSEIFQEMIELAGGSKAHIVVVPTASDTPDERALDYKKLFSEFNPESIHVVHIGERPDASSEKLVEIINQATLFMFSGGDQLRLSSLIGGTPLHEALLKRYKSGECVIAGTSAGAAVIPEIMIFQNNKFKNFLKGGTEMTQGLGLIPDVLFDTHFTQRSRVSRLVNAISTNPAILGLGIGENTGLVIKDETMAKVIGAGTVIVMDGSAIGINHIGYVENGKPFGLTNMNYSVLTHGMVYDLKQRKVIDVGPIAPFKTIVEKH